MTADQTPADREASLARIRQHVATVLSDVLGERLAEDDDFFDAGGSSVQAEEIIGRLVRLYPPGVTIRQFYENASVAGIAQVLCDNDLGREHRG